MSADDKLNDNQDLLERFPWASTPLGPPSRWPAAMHNVLRTVMASEFPICTAWGPDGIQIYNRAYNAIYGDKHPASFGQATELSWPEIWPFLSTALHQVREGETLWFRDTLLPLARVGGQPEECYFDFCYSPINDEQGRNLGVMSVASDKTPVVVAERRHRTQALDVNDKGVDPESLFRRLRQRLGDNPMDCATAVLFDVDGYAEKPGRALWTIRAEAHFVQCVRSAVASATEAGGARMITLPEACHGETHATGGVVVPVLSRNMRMLAVLLVVPAPLVPVERSLLRFLQTLSGRFHALLHASEAQQERIGQIQQRMERQEQLYRFLFDHIQDGAFYCDTSGRPDDDEIIMAVNPRACQMLGYREEELVGKSREEIFFPEDDTLSGALDRRHRHGHVTEELVFRTRSGEKLLVEIASSLEEQEDGKMRSLTIVRDITQRKALEQARADQMRLETMATLTGGLAHDFNNLLTVINGSVDFLTELLPPGSHEARLARNALEAGERAGELTSQLLSYARRQTLDTSAIDLPDFVRQLEPLMRSTAGEINHLRIDLDPDQHFVLSDRAQLTSAILNLVANARDAMPAGGEIRIGSSLQGDTEGRQFLRLQVSDCGSGMSEDVKSHMFEPFFTTRETGRGTGLGLPMVQGYMHQLGGDVEVHTVLGQGTEVALLLPLTEAAPATEESPDVKETPRHGLRVLAVEDNDLVREQCCLALESLGHTPVPAEDGPTALSLLLDDETIEVVLTDMVMPGGMSGLDLAREVHGRSPGVRVIITTGHDAEDLLSRSHEFPVLRKPYTRRELERVLG
ncbi:MAG: hybrid sensor histidine kinase/response regulator [Pseudomonadota bacterium]